MWHWRRRQLNLESTFSISIKQFNCESELSRPSEFHEFVANSKFAESVRIRTCGPKGGMGQGPPPLVAPYSRGSPHTPTQKTVHLPHIQRTHFCPPTRASLFRVYAAVGGNCLPLCTGWGMGASLTKACGLICLPASGLCDTWVGREHWAYDERTFRYMPSVVAKGSYNTATDEFLQSSSMVASAQAGLLVTPQHHWTGGCTTRPPRVKNCISRLCANPLGHPPPGAANTQIV